MPDKETDGKILAKLWYLIHGLCCCLKFKMKRSRDKKFYSLLLTVLLLITVLSLMYRCYCIAFWNSMHGVKGDTQK